MLVNGIYFSFVDITVRFDGLQLSAVKSINYKDSLGRNYVRGTSPIPLGLTTLVLAHSVLGLGFVIPIVYARYNELDYRMTEASRPLRE